MKKATILAVLFTTAHWLAGCTCTVQSDWPGQWGNKNQEQHTTDYRTR